MRDIEITGVDFFAIHGPTERGSAWIDEHVQGAYCGMAYSDDRRMTQDIADGALNAGLEVTINDRRYMGGGCVQADDTVFGKVTTKQGNASSVKTTVLFRLNQR